ncbi:Actin-related protein 5 [Nymphaea thermarum]|nr:Actin-related protein 5 [Nymphaea thermarum]
MPFLTRPSRQEDYRAFPSDRPVVIDNGAFNCRIGAEQVDHPVLITECACNPVHARSKMAELLFETYDVPSIDTNFTSCFAAFGVDAAFSYKYNQHLGVCNNDGIVISSGFVTSHVIPKTQKLKEKKKQIFLKTTSEGRQRAKQKRYEEELQRERRNQQDELKRLENPELYLEQLRAKHKELSMKVEQRKRLKTNGANNNGSTNASGGVGRGERLSAAQRERMRLLTTAAFDRGKGEDTFGAKDEDCQLYKLMSKDNDDDDDGQDEDEAELSRITLRLQDLDPTFVLNASTGTSQPVAEVPKFRPLTAKDFQINLGVERFRCPEVLFQPHIVGEDQAGLDEMVGISLRRLSLNGLAESMCNSILLTGGSCTFPGIEARLHAGITKLRPFGSSIRIVKASDPILDAWRGAAHYAASDQFSEQTFTRQDYYEKGEDWLRKYQFRYAL